MSELNVDTINEQTAANGVTIDGVKLKDNVVLTDTISESTSAAGVTIDGVLIKDGEVDGVDVSNTGLILLSSNTLSSSSGISVDNIFTSTYTNYKVIISWNASHTGTSSCKILLRAGGSDDTNSKYTSGVRTFRINSDNEFETRNDVQSSGWDLAGIDATQTGNQLSRELTLYSPQVSKRTGFSGTGITDEVTNQQMMYLGGAFEDTTSFDGITIKPQAGTVSGQVNIYGIVE